MMGTVSPFKSKHIGAELLRVITTGLYNDPLDTLREYVQNAIDAQARHVEVAIGPDVISIRDDGTGMDQKTAEAAIRLGLSEKDPIRNVGFRGIGIYSAFNNCDTLEIHTRPRRGAASKLVFSFKDMRDRLEREERKSAGGKPSDLCLEDLLGRTVWIETPEEPPLLATSGTFVILEGIKGAVHKRLTEGKQIGDYLKSVVPVPFHPDFHLKKEIEDQFAKQDYRVIDLELKCDGHSQKLYRPYSDEAFTHHRGIGPEFYKLTNVLAGGTLGFAWVCLNDARKYLSSKDLRGLLVKKFGFSVGERSSFAKFFSRVVFNNRITGEVIITHDGLIPSADRNDFEPGPLRDALHMAFDELAADISRWAEKEQNQLKAREELESVSLEVFKVAKTVPEIERDVSALLNVNTQLKSFEARLQTHKRTLKKLAPDLLERTEQALEEALGTIAEILGAKKVRKRKTSQRIDQAQRLQKKAPKTEELRHVKDRPRSLIAVANLFDVETTPEIAALLSYLDHEFLKEKLGTKEYQEFLSDLCNYLDEVL